VTKRIKPQWVVIKFGGTSVAEPGSWDTIAALVCQKVHAGFSCLVVCSALSGVSDLLASLVPAQAMSGDYAEVLDKITHKHRVFGAALGVDIESVIADELAALERIALGVSLTQECSPPLIARVMAMGEIMLTKIGAHYLNQKKVPTHWQDARQWLCSRENPLLSAERRFLSAACDYQQDELLQQALMKIKPPVVLTQGFIANNHKGQTVLLGRGGSDTSAAYFAAKLQAHCCEIWTDVPGIYTANPHHIPAARLLKSLTFDEAREIASTGAKVLHPHCLAPLAAYNIPLSIHCTRHPDWAGTQISNDVPLIEAQVKAISVKTGIVVIAMETISMWQQVGFLASVFACFQKHSVSVDLVSTSENTVTVSLDSDRFHYSAEALKCLLEDLGQYCTARVISPCAAISLIGRNIRAILHQLAPVFEVFKEQKVYLLTQATNDLNLTVVVDEAESEFLLHKIHALLFECLNTAGELGKSWQNAFPETIAATYWWYKKREALLALAKKSSPLYVYDESIFRRQVSRLQSLKHIDKIFYAMKANWDESVLRLFYQLGLGFECVSQGELVRIFNLFPEIDPTRILFTPNFAPKEEYQFALDKNVFVNLDNLHPLEHWPEMFAGREILLRIDPGLGRGHHKYVQTGGSHSKLGIAESQLDRVKAQVAAYDIRVIGLHVHFGSGVLAVKSWRDNAIFLAQVAECFPDVRILDLGGGLGVPEKFGQAELDLQALDDLLAPIKSAYPDIALWIEPGRYLVSQAGVLLTTVTQLKSKDDVDYIGVDTGMNSLIRPSLYTAYHEIVNLTRIDDPRERIAHIVGPICETGDTLGYSRVMPKTQEGDVVLITNAGAYGRVMSSSYNLREPAKELFLAVTSPEKLLS
jgi:bifunctional diaminopimelate decarboxylase / aspartate kinase